MDPAVWRLLTNFSMNHRISYVYTSRNLPLAHTFNRRVVSSRMMKREIPDSDLANMNTSGKVNVCREETRV